jgi:putative inorganic carbon (hco3(-)) transporter
VGKHLPSGLLLRPASGPLTLSHPLQSEPGPPILLQATALACFIFPANMILGPLGAAGYVAHILALLVMLLWLASVALGLHRTLEFEHPGRIAVGALVIVSCVAYAAMFVGISGPSSVTTRASADRWMLLMAASYGIVLMTTESIRTIDSTMVMVRAILRGGVFCSIVAAIQFVAHVDPMVWIQTVMPGFTNNGGNQPFQERGRKHLPPH